LFVITKMKRTVHQAGRVAYDPKLPLFKQNSSDLLKGEEFQVISSNPDVPTVARVLQQSAKREWVFRERIVMLSFLVLMTVSLWTVLPMPTAVRTVRGMKAIFAEPTFTTESGRKLTFLEVENPRHIWQW
tara:strand:+ start:443 stop:832 length:390 start_codon:yes stop_codon:yes gene_type:complete